MSRIGQVFLKDANIKLKMMKMLINQTNKEEINTIVEIGLGEGDMLKYLLQAYPDFTFYGVEIDPHLAVNIDNVFGDSIVVYNEDFLSIDLNNLVECIFFSNIPYQHTTKFIEKIIRDLSRVKHRIVAITIQKEVFIKLKESNSPSFYCFNYFFELVDKLEIKKQCFKPIPKVDSTFSIWKLRDNKKTNYSNEVFEIISFINNKKNKTIRNNLKITNQLHLLNDEIILEKRFNQLENGEKEKLIDNVLSIYKNNCGI